jgi:hypothetical protein
LDKFCIVRTIQLFRKKKIIWRYSRKKNYMCMTHYLEPCYFSWKFDFDTMEWIKSNCESFFSVSKREKNTWNANKSYYFSNCPSSWSPQQHTNDTSRFVRNILEFIHSRPHHIIDRQFKYNSNIKICAEYSRVHGLRNNSGVDKL